MLHVLPINRYVELFHNFCYDHFDRFFKPSFPHFYQNILKYASKLSRNDVNTSLALCSNVGKRYKSKQPISKPKFTKRFQKTYQTVYDMPNLLIYISVQLTYIS